MQESTALEMWKREDHLSYKIQQYLYCNAGKSETNTRFKLMCIWPFEIHKIKNISVDLDISLWEISYWVPGPRGFLFEDSNVISHLVSKFGELTRDHHQEGLNWAALKCSLFG